MEVWGNNMSVISDRRTPLAPLRPRLPPQLARSPELIQWRERGRMRELRFRMGGGGDGRMDVWMDMCRIDGRMDEWTGRARRRTRATSLVGQVRRVGREDGSGQEDGSGKGGHERVARAWTMPAGNVLKTLAAMKYGDPPYSPILTND